MAFFPSDDTLEIYTPPSDQCEAAWNYTLDQCSKKGMYCYHQENITYETVCTTLGTKDKFTSSCPNITINFEPCPNGYYCPNNSTKKSCPVGSSCYLGANNPRLCPIQGLLCPYEGMSYPSEGAMIVTFVIIFSLVLFTYKWISDHIVAQRERYIDSGTLMESLQQTQESEGDQYKRALIFLSEKKTEKLSFRINPNSFQSTKLLPSHHPLNGETPEERHRRVFAKWRNFIHSPAFRQHVQLMKEREKNLVNKITGSFTFQPISNPLTLTFDHLYYTLHSNGVSILKDIYGQFLPYNITALMGSSGAGKTTLLSLLRGKTYSGRISGEIFVNQQKVDSLVPFSSCMGFVPQDDIMYDELTVSENLKYAAMLFNRRGYISIPEVLPMVHHTMELLGLSFIKHSIVGSPAVKGISGGQKKRVNIGMELMKEPSLFFLDEPTSGLDSASSISLVNSLNKIAQNGVNIVATLHQPRVEIFDIINCVYLLAPGGRLAYFGPAFGLHNHLAMLGYHCPSHSNVSDFVMDVISGYVSPIWTKENLSVAETIKYICDTNDEKFHKKFDEKHMKKLRKSTRGDSEERSLTRQSSAENTNNESSSVSFVTERGGSSSLDMASISHIANTALDTVQRVPFVNIFSIALRRQLKVYFREMKNLINSKYVLVIMGILIGNLFSTVDLSKNTMASSITSSQLAFIICVQPDLLQIFLRDTDIRLREESGGISYAPLFLGKVLGSSFDLILSPIAFVVGYYPFIRSQATFGQYVGIFLLLMLAVSGLINFCAITFGKASAPVVTSGLVIVLWTVGGIQITKDSIYTSLSGFGRFLVAISPFTASFELHMVTELNKYSEAMNEIVDIYLNRFSYKLSHISSSIVHLILYFILANVIALGMLLYQRDNYQYWRAFCDQYLIPLQLSITESEIYKGAMERKRRVDEKTQEFVIAVRTCFRTPNDERFDYYSAAGEEGGAGAAGTVREVKEGQAATREEKVSSDDAAVTTSGVELI